MSQQRADHVIVVVFDGLRPDMISSEETPNLWQFAESGTWFRESRTIFPSLTRVATTSLATGCHPNRHGIVNNIFFHPAVYADRLLDTSKMMDLEAAETHHDGRFVTALTLGERLAAVGKRMAVCHAGSPGSTYFVNHKAKEQNHWTFSVHGRDMTRTPHAVDEAEAHYGTPSKPAIPRFDHITYANRVFIDLVLTRQRPDVSLIWYPEPDTSYHYREIGAKDSLRVIRHVDTAFGEILNWVSLQPDSDRIAVIALSDHGQITTDNLIPLHEHLTLAGFPTRSSELDGTTVAMTRGMMGGLSVPNNDRKTMERVAAWLMDQPFIGMVFSRGGNGVEGGLPGTFSLDMVHAEHTRMPDLVYLTASDERIDHYGLPGRGVQTGGVPVGGGMHGGLNRFELNNTLMLGGAGIASRGQVATPAGLIDVTPTILDLLGLMASAGQTPMMGRVLTEAFGDDRAEPDVPATHAISHRGFGQRLTVQRHAGTIYLRDGGRIL